MSALTNEGNAQPWVPTEFVVALPHLPIVLTELRKLPQPIHVQCDVSRILDLALVAISNVEDVARRINHELGEGERRTHRQAGQAEYAIDRVMRAVRERCRQRYGGWVPTLGKNRTLDGVQTSQGWSIGGGGYPSCPDDLQLGDLSRDDSTDRVSVGIVDTGFWPHPQFKGRYLANERDIFLSADDWYWHAAGHSAFVAGLVLQNSPNVDLQVRSVFSSPLGTARAWDVANEMVQLSRFVQVLNLSCTCFTDDNEEPLLLARAIELVGADTVIVAAAGNHGEAKPQAGQGRLPSANSPMWPAASSRVIAVGAHDHNGERAGFSPQVPWVDITARGQDVDSLYLEGTVKFAGLDGAAPPADTRFDGFARWSGTSFAAAVASGAIARRVGPGMTARQALRQVLDLPPGNSEGVWAYRIPEDESD